MTASVQGIPMDQASRAFMESIYCTYDRLLRSVARRCCADPILREDIVQESILRLLPKAPLLRELEEKALGCYLAVTIRNTAASFLREQARHQALLVPWDGRAEEVPDHTATPEGQLLSREERDCLKALWRQLPQADRTILAGRYLRGRTSPQLAQELGCTPNCIRMRLTRARRRAAECLTHQD